tara:strand:+ start:246 stop:446 length:201 start_codon:yes stop_codon:yes gene_type:complete
LARTIWKELGKLFACCGLVFPRAAGKNKESNERSIVTEVKREERVLVVELVLLSHPGRVFKVSTMD